MFRCDHGQWSWNGRPLLLTEPEPSLLAAMLRERGIRKPPPRWLGAESPTQATPPLTAWAFTVTLERKLRRAGVPAGILQSHPLLGALMATETPVADDPDTRTALAPPTPAAPLLDRESPGARSA